MQLAITWSNVDQYLCHLMASSSNNDSTQWYCRDVILILKCVILNMFCKLMCWEISVNLNSDEWHRISLIISQHWLPYWLGAISSSSHTSWHQLISRHNIDILNDSSCSHVCYSCGLAYHSCSCDIWNYFNRPHPIPDSKVHGANMGPTWVLLAPDGPHVSPMKLAIRDILNKKTKPHEHCFLNEYSHWLLLRHKSCYGYHGCSLWF